MNSLTTYDSSDSRSSISYSSDTSLSHSMEVMIAYQSSTGSSSTGRRSESPGSKLRDYRRRRRSRDGDSFGRARSWESFSGQSECTHEARPSSPDSCQLWCLSLDEGASEFPPGATLVLSLYGIGGGKQGDTARARWVVGNNRSSRGSSEDRSPSTLSRSSTPPNRLRRKRNASNLRILKEPSESQRSSDSSIYSENPITIWNPKRATHQTPNATLAQSKLHHNSKVSLSPATDATEKRKNVSFDIPGERTTNNASEEDRPRTGAELAAGIAFRKYGKSSPPFLSSASRPGFWRSASRKSADTRRRDTFRSYFFQPRDSSKPTRTGYRKSLGSETAAIPSSTNTEPDNTTFPEPSKAPRGIRRGRERRYLEAGTMRGRKGRYLRAGTLRKGDRWPFRT